MAQVIGRLSATKVANLKAPGYHADGGNLYFRVAPSGARGWIFRFTVGGRTRDMGLGAYPEIGLAAARELAEKSRKLVKEGLDPIEQRRHSRAVQRVAASKTKTFDDCVREYIDDNEAAWRNAKHRAQWKSTLASYASAVFGKLPVSEVDHGMVLRALKPIWHSKPGPAARHRLPAVYSYRFMVEQGGLMSYGVNTDNLFERAATYIDQILKGAKPADLPVQAPTKFELVINLKTIKALGRDVPPTLLARADDVLE